MLETFDVEKDVPNYYNYASDYIKDLFNKNVIHYFVVGDNLYLGAAYNAVMILKALIDQGSDNNVWY